MSRVPIIIPIRDASLGFGLLPRWLCRWVRGPLWRLEENYHFHLAGRRCGAPCGIWHFYIPRGYEFDKASIPPVLWGTPFNYLPDGLCLMPALEHDFLCDLLAGGSDWLANELGWVPSAPPARMVHEHFRVRLHECGVRRTKAEAMGQTVAALGPQGWAWPWLYAVAAMAISLTIYYFL